VQKADWRQDVLGRGGSLAGWQRDLGALKGRRQLGRRALAWD
jgi:hypothetical protein